VNVSVNSNVKVTVKMKLEVSARVKVKVNARVESRGSGYGFYRIYFGAKFGTETAGKRDGGSNGYGAVVEQHRTAPHRTAPHRTASHTIQTVHIVIGAGEVQNLVQILLSSFNSVRTIASHKFGKS